MTYMRLRPSYQAERRALSADQRLKPLKRYFIATRPVAEWQANWVNEIIILAETGRRLLQDYPDMATATIVRTQVQLVRLVTTVREFRSATFGGRYGVTSKHDERDIQRCICWMQEWVETFPLNTVRAVECAIISEAQITVRSD